MHKRLQAVFAALLIAGLGGCANIIHSDGKTVLIEHGTGASKEAVTIAQTECQKQEMTIEFEDMRCPGRCISKFRCVAK